MRLAVRDGGGERVRRQAHAPTQPSRRESDGFALSCIAQSMMTRRPPEARIGFMDIDMLVEDFAWAMHEVDSFRPQARSQRVAGRQYQPGVGPFSEPEAVSLTVDMMQRVLEGYSELRPMRYPRSRNTCDLVWGDPPGWAIEVKLARVRRDNGTDEPAAVKKILSPYLADASAVTDAWRLSASEFACRKAILIYGFDDPERPLEDLIRAFEAVARLYVRLGLRSEGDLGDLVHPVFRSGRVFAWEVEPT